MNASDVLPAQFNVASWFVDKNVAEGRGASPAFLHEDRRLTYADVQELVNRTGNALLELGVEMETRVLMLCLDAPEFIGTFWGAIKIGAVPVPVKDRKSTRLNSSHTVISYAVFCLKKKKKKKKKKEVTIRRTNIQKIE